MLHPGAWTQGPAAKLRPPNRICIMLSAPSDFQSVQESTEYSNSENSDVQDLTGQDSGATRPLLDCVATTGHAHARQPAEPA